MTKYLSVYCSGQGSNLEAILKKIDSGFLSNIQVNLVLTNKLCGANKIAERYSIDNHVIDPINFEDQLSFLQAHHPDLIVLAGYLKLLPQEIIELYPNQIINIHPALLPKYGGAGYYGLKVHQAVLDNHEEFSGATVHYVNEKFDQGKIITQEKLAVLSDDTAESLQDRIKEQIEWKILPETIKKLLN